MASTLFIDFDTKIEASWLNPVDAHVYGTSGVAHTASTISVDPPISGIVATDVYNALQELYTAIGGATGAVSSVNGKTGNVVLDSSDFADIYSKSEVDALLGSSGSVTSVNGQTGAVILDHTDVGAAPASHNHNDLYYTKTQSDNRYYTQAEVDDLVGANSTVYESPRFAATVGVLRTAAHGFSDEPDMAILLLVNTQAEHGYVPGDIVIMNPTKSDQDEGSGTEQASNLISFDDTNVYFALADERGNGVHISPKSNAGDAERITQSRWEVFIRAYKFGSVTTVPSFGASIEVNAVEGTKTADQSINGTSYVDYMTKTINVANNNSKLLLIATFGVQHGGGHSTVQAAIREGTTEKTVADIGKEYALGGWSASRTLTALVSGIPAGNRTYALSIKNAGGDNMCTVFAGQMIIIDLGPSTSGVQFVESPELDYSSVGTGSLEWLHGQGTRPIMCQAYVRCVASAGEVGGYVVGDEVMVQESERDGSRAGFHLYTNDDVVGLAAWQNVSTQLRVTGKTGSGGNSYIADPAHWRVVIRATFPGGAP